MSFDAIAVALVLSLASAIGIGFLIRKHGVYRESVADALARGDVAKEEVEVLKRQLQDLNQKLVISSGREEGLKATLAIKETEHAEKIALLEDAKKMLPPKILPSWQIILRFASLLNLDGKFFPASLIKHFQYLNLTRGTEISEN